MKTKGDNWLQTLAFIYFFGTLAQWISYGSLEKAALWPARAARGLVNEYNEHSRKEVGL